MVRHGAMRTESSEAALAKLANAPVRSEADASGALWFQEARKTEEVKRRANDHQPTSVTPAEPICQNC